jgi:hypothetical protein
MISIERFQGDMRGFTSLSVVGECAKRVSAHSPTALSELKPRISPEILGHMKKRFSSLRSSIDRTH